MCTFNMHSCVYQSGCQVTTREARPKHNTNLQCHHWGLVYIERYYQLPIPLMPPALMSRAQTTDKYRSCDMYEALLRLRSSTHPQCHRSKERRNRIHGRSFTPRQQKFTDDTRSLTETYMSNHSPFDPFLHVK